MNIYKLASLLLLLVSISSCKKEASVPINDYVLVFGEFAGFVETYVLTNDKLYEELNAEYAVYDETTFDLRKLSNEKYLEARDLLDFFPTELLDEEDKSFGCPNCVDQGGIFVGFNQFGTLRKWRIDTDKSEVPAYLHEFMDKVREKMDLLRD